MASKAWFLNNEVILYRQSVLETNTEPDSQTNLNGAFIQWSADNVDHNLATLDGKGTFHGMGIVESSTPAGSFSQTTCIPRLKKRKPVAEVIKERGVPIIEYDGSIQLNSFPKINALSTINVRDVHSFDLNSELFWHLNWHFFVSTSASITLVWIYATTFCHINRPSLPRILVFLPPIIDLQPPNLTCTYSTLLFAACLQETWRTGNSNLEHDDCVIPGVHENWLLC